MIAVDTNVLLRYLLDDDIEQSPRAARLFRRDDGILVTDVVLAETLWTLAGRKYRASRTDLAAVIDSLFREPVVEFEDRQAVWGALGDFEATAADFQDALILHKARRVAEQAQDPLSALYTFDVAALELDGARRPA
jgi:predicted nucleic-acid-binding protein